jgi:hypothetical protein
MLSHKDGCADRVAVILDLAAGYHVSDLLIQRAIEVDHKQGISSKFLAYMSKFDEKVGSTGKFHPNSLS